MADDTTGGTLIGLPGLTLPGVVGEGGPGDGLPTLAPLTTEFAPPASLSVPEGPALGGNAETAVHGMEAASAAGDGSLAGVASMSTVMMAGITVAALRGAYHAVAYLKARAEHFKAVRDQQNAATGKANTELERARAAALAAQQRGRVQSGPEFGRNSRNSGPNSSPNSGRPNSQVPSTFRSTGQTGPGGPQPKKPETGRGGPQGGRPGPAGSTGPRRVQEARRKALEDSGRKGRQEGNFGAQNGSRNGSLNGGQQRPGRQPAGSDTIRGAARQRAADRILNGPKDKQPGSDRKGPGDRPGKPERQPAGPDTVRGAARRRVADRITTGTWKPTGTHGGGGATPTTIRGAVRKRAVDRILNGKKPKDTASTAKDGTADTSKPTTPSTELVVRPGRTGAGTGTGTAGTASAGARSGRRFRRVFTPGGESGSRPWRLRRPGTTAPGSPDDLRARKRREQQERKARKRREQQERRARKARERAERANVRRAQRARRDYGTGPTGQADGAGADGFGPPPGWVHSPGVKVRRYDRPDPDRAAPAIGRGQAALPRAPHRSPHARPGTTRPIPMPAASPVGGRPVTIPVPRAAYGTQYQGDSELTIHDVIEADADMAEEILQGADDAREAAEGCEKLLGRLEALHAKVVDRKVPGVLEGMVASLIENAEEVKAKADSVAEKIPAAAEAIAVAGTNAARRDKQVADTTRDMGHAAPAERDYHEK
ncbi:hypothetical protein ABZW30_13285 [Kitasatospora sp. NPDC004669]|uniref:hypothetical protein n=1 Tax=Kitasatospora sp. NPDC004669 TaxID=3154555 RepID=UPI0033BCB1D1